MIDQNLIVCRRVVSKIQSLEIFVLFTTFVPWFYLYWFNIPVKVPFQADF